MVVTVFHSVLCSDITIDSRSGQISYFKIIDTVTAPSLPVSIKGAYVGALCQSSETTPVMVRLALFAPDNNATLLKEFSATFTEAPQKLLVQLEQILLMQQGAHRILLLIKNEKDWHSVASMPILVQSQNGQE